MEHDIEKIRTDMADLAVELVNGVEGPRLSYYLQILGKERHNNNGWHETSEFLELCESAKRMALNKVWGRDRDLKSEVLEYFNVTSCDASITELCQHLTIVTKKEKGRLRTILSRLVSPENVLENRGRGHYHLVKEASFIDWTTAETSPVSLWLPFELSSPDFSVLTPGDMVIIMGTPNAGKTAATMSIAKENRRNYRVYYFSTEITPSSFNRRMRKFKDCSTDQMKEIRFSNDFSDFADVIQPGEGVLNIIDYLDIYKDFAEIGARLSAIHSKLKGAIAVVNIQKDPNKEVGIGGFFNQMKPMLSISLDPGNIATITKCKEWNPNIPNPNRKVYHYKLIDGCKFTRATPSVGWVNKSESQHGLA